MAETRPKNYPTLKNYKPSRFMLPTSHYDAEKADRAVRFIENLRHTKGKWAGKRFWLLPWQEQIIRDVFGIVDERGNRQFRTAYVEIGKKNGKSELAAAVALYLLFADNEPSAEVYGAAADRQQASIVFDVANQMVQMTPALMKRCKIMAATNRVLWNPEEWEHDVLLVWCPRLEYQHKSRDVAGAGQVQSAITVTIFQSFHINRLVAKVVDVFRDKPGQRGHPHIQTKLFEYVLLCRVVQGFPVSVPDALNADGLSQ